MVRDSNSNPISNATIWIYDNDFGDIFIYHTDPWGNAYISAIEDSTEIKITLCKYVTNPLKYTVSRPNDYIDTLYVTVDLLEKIPLYVELDNTEFQKLSKNNRNKHSLTELLRRDTNDEFHSKEIILTEEIEKVSDLVNYSPVNTLEKLFTNPHSTIIYPIKCFNNKAVIRISHGRDNDTYLLKIEDRKIKYKWINSSRKWVY